MKTLIYFTNLVSICMNIWINTLFYWVLYMIGFSLCFLISDLDFLFSVQHPLYALAGPKIGQIKSCILYTIGQRATQKIINFYKKKSDTKPQDAQKFCQLELKWHYTVAS